MNIQPVCSEFQLPVKSSTGAGAYDLFMPKSGTLFPYEEAGQFYGLGFKAEVPEGHVALLLPRSGKGAKNGLSLNNTVGVIDPDYRGEWMVCLRNRNADPFSWEAGERLIQMLVIKSEEVDFTIVESLDETGRGESGFGHTG